MLNLSVELWMEIFRHVSVKDICSLQATSSENIWEFRREDLWRELFKRDYSFVTSETLQGWNFQFTHFDAYKAVETKIKTWSSEFFWNYSVCNLKYANKELMMQDIREIVVGLISSKTVSQGEIAQETHDMIGIVSGLHGDFVPACSGAMFDGEKEQWKAQKYLKSILLTFKVQITE